MCARLRAIGYLVAISAALPQTAETVRASAEPRVAVRVVATTGQDDQIVAGMFRELVSTWQRCGVTVLPYAQGLEPPPTATVSLILAPGWPPPEAAGGLGWIRFVLDPESHPAPVLMVSLAATRALVDASDYRGTPVAQRPSAVGRTLLARALGRAAAHELGHYLLASRAHARRGLMRARFNADELVSEDGAAFRLADSDRQALKICLREARFLTADAGAAPSCGVPRI